MDTEFPKRQVSRQNAIRSEFSEHLVKAIEQGMAAAFERSTALCISEMHRMFDRCTRRSEARYAEEDCKSRVDEVIAPRGGFRGGRSGGFSNGGGADHLQVQHVDCSHLSFGSFRSRMGAGYSSDTMKFVHVEPNLEKLHSEVDILSVGHMDISFDYYVDDSLRNASDGSMLQQSSANAGDYDPASASQHEELKSDNAEGAHGSEYTFPPSNPGYTSACGGSGNDSLEISTVCDEKVEIDENLEADKKDAKEEGFVPEICDEPKLLDVEKEKEIAVSEDKEVVAEAEEVDVVVDELLLDIEQAALDPFYLREKGSLDTVWEFVSSLRSSTYLHGSDYKIYNKRVSGGNQKSAKSPKRTTTPRASKRQRKSKKAANTEAIQGKTLPCLILAFTPGFAWPLKEEVVGLFSKFGCLNTEETKIETDSHSVRIVYSNDSDAEAALKSSLTQCAFGSENVNYVL